MALIDDYNQGIIRKSTYIRMCITTPRHQLGDSYEIQLPLQGVSEADVFSEAAALVLNEFVSISLSSFTVTWLQPELLPSYSADAVRGMKVGGQGYLYFALGADNLSKTSTQLVEPGRLTGFYGMTNAEILAELGRLTGAKTCTTNITKLSVQWLNKSAPAAREFDSIAAVVVQLRKEISEAIEKIPKPTPSAGVNHTHSLSQIEQLANELNNLAEEINDRQIRGDYALTTEVNRVIEQLQQAVDSKTSEDDFNQAVAILTNEISEKAPALHRQPIDSIIDLRDALNQLAGAIETKAPIANYALQSALNQAIADFSRDLDQVTLALDTKQASGDYPLRSDLAAYALKQALTDAVASLQKAIDGKQPAGNYQPAGDYAAAIHNHAITAITGLQAALDSKQAVGNYALQQALTDAIASLTTAINAKQPAGNYALSTDLTSYQPKGNYALQQALTDAIASLQAAINGKQAAGSYIIEGDARLTDSRNPLAHTQAISTITGLQTALDGKQAAGSYAPLSHTQDISTINGLQTALDGKQAAGSYAPLNHTQAISTITGLQTALDGKQATGDYPLRSDLSAYQPKGDYPLRSEIISSPKVTRSLYSANSPANPVIGDVWEAYDSNGDTFDAERWTYNGTYWVSQRRIANWSFNAVSAASNFFELLDKYPNKHGILFEWFTIGMKAGASNSASAYATFTLSRRDSSGVSSTLSSFSTSAIAASGRLYSMKDLKVSYPYDQAIDAVIALTLTGSPGAMSGSASFSYRYAW